ncbi:hypothetical protein [Bacillus velezensis]|uniref:hypothetical protein n=1 Tax=Bacillus velezensis TaxID=492670 RepID=UPI0026EE99F5|nr:hypothetical protein [Bacillus velezensis]
MEYLGFLIGIGSFTGGLLVKGCLSEFISSQYKKFEVKIVNKKKKKIQDMRTEKVLHYMKTHQENHNGIFTPRKVRNGAFKNDNKTTLKDIQEIFNILHEEGKIAKSNKSDIWILITNE